LTRGREHKEAEQQHAAIDQRSGASAREQGHDGEDEEGDGIGERRKEEVRAWGSTREGWRRGTARSPPSSILPSEAARMMSAMVRRGDAESVGTLFSPLNLYFHLSSLFCLVF